MVKLLPFKPLRIPLITSGVANRIIQAIREGKARIRVSLDLGRSWSWVEVRGRTLLLPSGFAVSLDVLKEVARDDKGIYGVFEGRLSRVAFSESGKFYKLVKVRENTAPTLEISGIHMHRIEGVTPLEDTREKLSLARVKRGHVVLDVCTGLGYTAIEALRRGAKKVVTIERDPMVLGIARVNPWSVELASKRISIVLGDASEVITELCDEFFDRVVHDPPRMRLAGELYGLRFYRELYRVLKPGGVMFHYTGQPGIKRGLYIIQGVSRRLREAGFSVKVVKGLGVVAFKSSF